MQLKPFEAGRYDDASIVVANPTNGKQELFSEREYAIVKFLKQNENQSLLALLMPNIGIAKKNHIEMCLGVLGKLKRMQIVDYFSITGRKPVSDTLTAEVAPDKGPIEVPALAALSATAFGTCAKGLSYLGSVGILSALLALAAVTLLLFPFEAAEAAVREASVSYLGLFLLSYLSVCAGLSLRALAQAAYLRGLGREEHRPAFVILPPFVSLAADTRAIHLFGYRARAQMALLGAAAPLALAALFTLPALGGFLPLVPALVGFAACAGTCLALLCPLLPFDGATLLQVFFFRQNLEEKVSFQLRDIFHARGSIPRELLLSLGISLLWVLVWLDCLRAFRDAFQSRLSADLVGGEAFTIAGAGTAVAVLVALALAPVAIVLVHHGRELRRRQRRRVVLRKDDVNENLSFEERMAALERIPLFTYLNDQERLALQNEMEPVFFRGGSFLVHQGEVGREFFVLVKGQACAQFTNPAGKTTVLAELVAGDAFGEIALIDDVPRTASIFSEGGCIALVLRKDGFDHFAESLGSPDRVKSLVRLTSFFRRHPLFSKLTAREQAQLADSFRFQTITAGDQVPDGDENFHVIYAGSVRVDTGGADGETLLKSDDCFGYANPLHARFVALDGTGLLTVAKDGFHNLIWEKLVARQELFF